MSSDSPAPTEVVRKLLENTLKPEIVRDLMAPDATYISLNYDNADLAKILPYAGTHAKGKSRTDPISRLCVHAYTFR